MPFSKKYFFVLASVLTVCFISVLAAFAYYAHWYFNYSSKLDEGKTHVISRGSSLKKISYDLYDSDIIDNPFLFRKLSTLYMAEDDSFKAGEYHFDTNVTPREVYEKLLKGSTKVRLITFPEGFSSTQIKERLNNMEGLVGDITIDVPEGSLLPDTYYFSFGDTRNSVIEHMQQRMVKISQDLWEKRQDGLPYKSLEEALIMASIIEKETSVDKERGQVASVFVNRLRKRMRLQTDPTVIYAMTKGEYKLDRPLLRKDLQIDSPYNTYKNYGLPPAPICNPGEASIAAALSPDKTGYYYFVAKGDGGHYFAKTLKGHNENVSRYRRWQKQNRVN